MLSFGNGKITVTFISFRNAMPCFFPPHKLNERRKANRTKWTVAERRRKANRTHRRKTPKRIGPNMPKHGEANRMKYPVDCSRKTPQSESNPQMKDAEANRTEYAKTRRSESSEIPCSRKTPQSESNPQMKDAETKGNKICRNTAKRIERNTL